MSPCEIEGSKDSDRNKHHHQANAGNDDPRMCLLSLRWRRQSRLRPIAITLTTGKLRSLRETTVLGIIPCLVWLRRCGKLTRPGVSTSLRRSWEALLPIAGLKVLAIASRHY